MMQTGSYKKIIDEKEISNRNRNGDLTERDISNNCFCKGYKIIIRKNNVYNLINFKPYVSLSFLRQIIYKGYIRRFMYRVLQLIN